MNRRAANIGRALRHRNFRLFFAGQGVSLVGTWLTRFAIGWMTYRLSGSALTLGLVAFFSQAPTAVLAPFAGVLVDRWDRHRTIVLTQAAAMLQSAALAVFALTHTMTVYHLMVLGAVQAVINAFDMPARQSFLGRMVEDRADLPNAIALNSVLVNGARFAGPVFASALVALFGEGLCFTIDAASYLAVIASLLAMRITKQPPRARKGEIWKDLREGVVYVRDQPMIRSVLLLLAASSTLGTSYSTLLPLVVGDNFHGGPGALGILMGAAGVGAVLAALYLASRETVVGLGRVIAACATALGAGLISLEAAYSMYEAIPLLCVIGAAMMLQMASTNTLIQTLVPEDKLGRVMSLYGMAFFGGAPLGALLAGTLASAIGAIHTFAVFGALCLVCGLAFWRALPALRIVSRPRYVELGLIPDEVA